jgi:hypothetical protein
MGLRCFKPNLVLHPAQQPGERRVSVLTQILRVRTDAMLYLSASSRRSDGLLDLGDLEALQPMARTLSR